MVIYSPNLLAQWFSKKCSHKFWKDIEKKIKMMNTFKLSYHWNLQVLCVFFKKDGKFQLISYYFFFCVGFLSQTWFVFPQSFAYFMFYQLWNTIMYPAILFCFDLNYLIKNSYISKLQYSSVSHEYAENQETRSRRSLRRLCNNVFEMSLKEKSKSPVITI